MRKTAISFGARRRGRRRGAAMVEALVVIPFFIILFACTIFAHAVYRAKVDAMKASRHAAFASASNGCTGGEGDDLFAVATAGGNLAEASSAPHANLATKRFGMAQSTVTDSVVAPKAIGGSSVAITATTRVFCNEKAVNGEPLVVSTFLWNDAKAHW